MKKWKPSASQRRAFAEKMKDPTEQTAYLERKRQKNSYNGFKDREFVATKEQHEFAMTFMQSGLKATPEQEDACNQVLYSYSCNEKVHHDYIHIVNELRKELAHLFA